MKSEVNFYQADDVVTKSIAPLLLKVLEEKKRALIFCNNPQQMKEIDASLWSYGRNKFIPHVLISDKEFDLKRQPIVLSSEEENPNDAHYLVFLNEPSSSFAAGFERVFYFFEEGNFNTAKTLAQKMKPKNSYKKEDGKWVKLSW